LLLGLCSEGRSLALKLGHLFDSEGNDEEHHPREEDDDHDEEDDDGEQAGDSNSVQASDCGLDQEGDRSAEHEGAQKVAQEIEHDQSDRQSDQAKGDLGVKTTPFWVQRPG
jgi:hypothetical protein